MFASWFAGTHESAADTQHNNDGQLYKVNFGMASHRAVVSRNKTESPFDMAKKELFREGISESRIYFDPNAPGVEDIIDSISSGVRSAMTYTGAKNKLTSSIKMQSSAYSLHQAMTKAALFILIGNKKL